MLHLDELDLILLKLLFAYCWVSFIFNQCIIWYSIDLFKSMIELRSKQKSAKAKYVLESSRLNSPLI